MRVRIEVQPCVDVGSTEEVDELAGRIADAAGAKHITDPNDGSLSGGRSKASTASRARRSRRRLTTSRGLQAVAR